MIPVHPDRMQTTSGSARLQDGYVVIDFGYLDENRQLHRLVLDVDAYAIELVRDLAAALSEQKGIEEDARLDGGVNGEEDDHRHNDAPFCAKCGGPCAMTFVPVARIPSF